MGFGAAGLRLPSCTGYFPRDLIVKDLFIVSCTRGRKEDTDLYPSLCKLGIDRYLFIESNVKGLSCCYNSILNERSGRDEIVIFVHDDVTIGDLFFQEKILSAFRIHGYAVGGLAGTSDFTINPDLQATMWFQQPYDACSGAVEHRISDGDSTLMFVAGLTPKRCVVLDGLLLAVDLKQIGPVRFDEQFAFHFYDLDFCLTVHRAGLVMGTMNVYVTHRSVGNYQSQEYKEMQSSFRKKWKAGRYRIGDASTFVASRSVPRRNEACHCGSGLKYKHCHGRLA
jgi:hypothetical protein